MAKIKVTDRRRVTATGARSSQQKPGDLPSISHQSLLDPLMKASRYFKEHVHRDAESGRLQPGRFWMAARGLLISSEQTYAAICILVAGNRPKPLPLQGNVLLRALLEALGNLMGLSEDPEKRTTRFIRDGYRELFEQHKRLKADFGSLPKWKGWLRENEQVLTMIATDLKLTPEEANEPDKHLKDRWPTPGRMLSARMLTGTRRDAFEALYSFWYATLSGFAHQRMRALSAAIVSDDAGLQWRPGRAESLLVAQATLFFLCVLSEVEVLGSFPPNTHLRVAWERARPLDDMAETLVRVRYGRLLGL